MKINHEYLKKLLLAYQAAEGPTTDLKELERNGIDICSKEFVFHVTLLLDKGLVIGSGRSGGIGLEWVDDDRMTITYGVQSRLTAEGHELIEALEQPDIWETITTGFKTASIETLMSISRELLVRIIKRQAARFLAD